MTTVILILLGSIIGVGVVLRLLHKPDDSAEPAPETPSNQPEQSQPVATGDVCCGQHAVCEKDSLIQGLDPESLYFDDEELDAFRGRAAADYTDEEIEQFRDVLLTLMPDDVAPWARSIAQRGIELPLAVRDELIMIVDDIRQSRLTASHQAS